MEMSPDLVPAFTMPIVQLRTGYVLPRIFLSAHETYGPGCDLEDIEESAGE